MPLSQRDPSLDYDGSWGDASKGWPSITLKTEEEARAAYIKAWRGVKIPYGCYVLVGRGLRLETPNMKEAALAHLFSAAGQEPEQLGPCFTDP